MQMFIARFVMLLVAIALLVDDYAPMRVGPQTVVSHSMSWRVTRSNKYTLHFDDGPVHWCDVGKDIYDGLKDGDAVTLTTSRYFGRCEGIARGDTVFEKPNIVDKLLPWLFAILAFAFAFGWIDLRRSAVNDGDDEGDSSNRPWWWFFS